MKTQLVYLVQKNHVRSFPNSSVRHWLQRAVLGFFLMASICLPPLSRGQTLDISQSGTDIMLSWTGGGSLQGAYMAEGPWAALSGATSPYLVPQTAPHQFFRLLVSGTGGTQSPVVASHVYSTLHDQSLILLPPGLLDGASDPNGLNLTSYIYAPPVHGSVFINPDGSMVYTPSANFAGTDSFIYVGNNGILPSATAAVTVYVTNSAPLAVDDSLGVPMNTAGGLTAPGVLANDSDPTADALSAILVSTVTHGSLTLQSDGSFQYVPDNGYSGFDSFTYLANDGIASSPVATVTINVHGSSQAPTVTNLTFLVEHDQTLSVPVSGVLVAASNLNNDPMTAAPVTPPANGTVALMPDGSFIYQPNAGFMGTDSFTFTAQTTVTSSAPATVTVLVTNTAPLAVTDTFYGQPNVTLTVPASGVLVNDGDNDGDGLTAILLSTTASGTLTLSSNGGFDYLPNNGFTGTDAFTYGASDGVSTSAVTLVTLIITNRPPLAVADNYGVASNLTLTVLAPGVLYNDSDPAGNSLTAATVAQPPNGTVTLSANGSFVYQPNPGFTGTDTFTYTASNGFSASISSVTISVVASNQAPLAVNDEYYTRTESAVTNTVYDGVLGNDIEINFVPLTASLVSTVSHGTLTLNPDGSFIYVPATDFNGTDSFTYTASNGSLSSSPATVTITVEDKAPVVVADGYTVHANTTLSNAAPGVLNNDYDADDNDQLYATLVTATTHGSVTLASDGSFVYVPTNNYIGRDSFTYRADDGMLTGAVATVYISVVNSKPVAGDDEYSTVVSTTLTNEVPGVMINDYDSDNDSMTVSVVTGPAHASSFTLYADGSFSYTPVNGYLGTDTFTYKNSDGLTNSDAGQVTINVISSLASSVRPKANGQPEMDIVALGFGGVGGAPISSDTIRFIANGVVTGVPLVFTAPQWLDNNGDGFINPATEHSFPYCYVRGATLTARLVFRIPNRNAFINNVTRQYYPVAVRGQVFNNGVATVLTMFPTRPFGVMPDRVGPGGTVYVDVAANGQLPNVVGVLNLGIKWQFSVNNGPWQRAAPLAAPANSPAGTSWHKIYLTWGFAQTWPLFETIVAYGSVSGAGTANPNVLVDRIWNNFKFQNARRVDGTRLHYYRNWNIIQNPATTVPNLLLLADGRCGTWAQFFINTLQAQGLAPNNLRAVGVYSSTPSSGFMVKNWNFGLPGPTTPNYAPGLLFRSHAANPQFPFENIFVPNNVDTFPPFNANVVGGPFGVWQYLWAVAPKYDYVGGVNVNKGQNNITPRAMFTDHAIVAFGGIFFDPSYGTTYLNPFDMQGKALDGIWRPRLKRDLLVNGFLSQPYFVLEVKPTPPGAPARVFFRQF